MSYPGLRGRYLCLSHRPSLACKGLVLAIAVGHLFSIGPAIRSYVGCCWWGIFLWLPPDLTMIWLWLCRGTYAYISPAICVLFYLEVSTPSRLTGKAPAPPCSRGSPCQYLYFSDLCDYRFPGICFLLVVRVDMYWFVILYLVYPKLCDLGFVAYVTCWWSRRRMEPASLLFA